MLDYFIMTSQLTCTIKKKDVKFKDLYGSCAFFFIKAGMVLKEFFPMDAVKCGKHCHHNLLRTDVTNLQYCFLSIEQ